VGRGGGVGRGASGRERGAPRNSRRAIWSKRRRGGLIKVRGLVTREKSLKKGAPL